MDDDLLLRDLVELFCEEVEAISPPGNVRGQQVNSYEVFDTLTPSARKRLQWWASEFRAKLQGRI